MTGKVNMLMGIGNRLRGDDGAGSILAENFQHHGWVSLDTATVPENFTGKIKKIRPALLVIVDGCRMGLEPGEFRRIHPDHVSSGGDFLSHSGSTSLLLERITPYIGEIIIIGIEPGNTDLSEGLSEPVSGAVKSITEIIKRGEVGRIRPLYDT